MIRDAKNPMNDPVSGPVPREKLKEAAALPHGEARKLIRRYDPQWGYTAGEKFPWDVQVIRPGADRGTATIMAADQEEADELAADLDESDVSWDYSGDGITVVSVEPAKPA
jgi:hypothetical protein